MTTRALPYELSGSSSSFLGPCLGSCVEGSSTQPVMKATVIVVAFLLKTYKAVPDFNNAIRVIQIVSFCCAVRVHLILSLFGGCSIKI